MRIRTLTAVLVAAGLLLGACGDDDDSSDLEPYSDALVESFDTEEEELDATPEQKKCFADRAVEIVGIERLEEVGSPEEVIEATEDDLSVFELSDEELTEVGEAFVGCVPDLQEQLRQQIVGEAGLSESQQECVLDLLSDDVIVQILSATLGGGDALAALEPLQADFEECEQA